MNIISKVEKKVKETIEKEKLCNKKEKILVALSGGKDSTSTVYLLKKLGYDVEGFYIDLGLGNYSKRCLNAVKELCKILGIKLYVYSIQKKMGASMCYIRSSVQAENKLKNCAVCGIIKKSIMNKEARRFKFNKIATGHNLDDEVQTFLINLFKGSPELSANIGAITKNVPDKKFVSRIKPLFYVAEADIREYAKIKQLPFISESCPCGIDSYRIEVRKFLMNISEREKLNIIKNFEKIQPFLKVGENAKINYCENCGEPSRNKLCKKCQLLNSQRC
jgi:uncharacterized protein (TIGR00269 family)